MILFDGIAAGHRCDSPSNSAMRACPRSAEGREGEVSLYARSRRCRTEVGTQCRQNPLPQSK